MTRVTFSKAERAEGLRLATAQAEAQAAFRQWMEKVLLGHKAMKENDGSSWTYDPLTGVAERQG